MNDDDNRRAMARCEEQYLREPDRGEEDASDETIEAVARAAYEAGRADGLTAGMREVERLMERLQRECVAASETIALRRDASAMLGAHLAHKAPWRDLMERVCVERRAHHRRGAK